MASRDPVAEVFRLPELVSLIVQHCLEPYRSGDREPYWGLACVARSWLGPVMSITWRRVRLHKLFAATSEPSRRQYYADQVRHLLIIFPERMDGQLSTLSFHRLESVMICVGTGDSADQEVSPSTDLWVQRLLGPSLRSLDLRSEPGRPIPDHQYIVPDDLPVSLANLCPGLEKLQISLRENDPSSVLMLAQIVEALPRLCFLQLNSQLPSISSERLLTSLSSLPHLESLKFEGAIPDLSQISSQFPQLTTLHGQATHSTLTGIGLLMPRLVHLDLELPHSYVTEPGTLVIAPLRFLIKLEHLTLRVRGDAPLESKDLETLARFCNLTRLWIGSHARSRVTAPDFTDEKLCRIVRCWPLMVSLELRIQHPSGGQALLALARHCPRIQSIYMPGHYDVEGLLALQQPAFSDLSVLCVSSLFWKRDREDHLVTREEFRMMFEVLAQHVPKLSHVRFNRCDRVGTYMNAALGRGLEVECRCGQYGEGGEEHKIVDHMLDDRDEEGERI